MMRWMWHWLQRIWIHRLFVPIAVEEIREGTVRTEVIEDRDQALADIEAGLGANEEWLRLLQMPSVRSC